MKFVYYLQNGMVAEALPEGYNQFYIAENIAATSEHSRYFYKGDKIQYSLDRLCVDLYDVFQDAIFPLEMITIKTMASSRNGSAEAA